MPEKSVSLNHSPFREGHFPKNWEKSNSPFQSSDRFHSISPASTTQLRIPFAVSADPSVLNCGLKDHNLRRPFYEAEQRQQAKIEETLNFFKHQLSSQKREQSEASISLSKVAPENITTFGRLNKLVPKLVKFDPEAYNTSSSPINRMHAVSVNDALVDPFQSQSKWRDPLTKRDPGHNKWDKIDQQTRDQRAKVIIDYKGRPIMKLDPQHGYRNGGLFLQSTFNRSVGEPDLKQQFERSYRLANAAKQVIERTPQSMLRQDDTLSEHH